MREHVRAKWGIDATARRLVAEIQSDTRLDRVTPVDPVGVEQ